MAARIRKRNPISLEIERKKEEEERKKKERDEEEEIRRC